MGYMGIIITIPEAIFHLLKVDYTALTVLHRTFMHMAVDLSEAHCCSSFVSYCLVLRVEGQTVLDY